MLKKRYILIASFFAIILSLCIIAGATLSLGSGASSFNVAVTSANVEVVATAENLRIYSVEEAESGVGEDTVRDENGVLYRYVDRTEEGSFLGGGEAFLNVAKNELRITGFSAGDKVEFMIFVENRSNVAINYRTEITVSEAGEEPYEEAEESLLSCLDISVGELGTVTKGNTVYTDWSAVYVRTVYPETVPVSISLPVTGGNEFQGRTFLIGYSVYAIAYDNATRESLRVGEREFVYLSDAVAYAEENGLGEIELFANTPVNESVTVQKPLVIKSAPGKCYQLADARLIGKKGASLTLESIAFSGNSYVDASDLAVLTVKNCTIQVIPERIRDFTTRELIKKGAFVMSCDEQQSGLRFTFTGNTVLCTKAADGTPAAAIYLGGSVKEGTQITGNTFGSEKNYYGDTVLGIRSALNGTIIEIRNNEIYGNTAFDFGYSLFGREEAEPHTYMISTRNNRIYTKGVDYSVVRIEGKDSVGICDNGTTLNGSPISENDMKTANSLFSGVDVVMDSNREILKGKFCFDGRMDLVTFRHLYVASEALPENVKAYRGDGLSIHLDGGGYDDAGNFVVREYTIENEAGLFSLAAAIEENTMFAGAVLSLEADIRLESEWVPVMATKGQLENATFNGNGHTISHIRVTNGGESGRYAGFIGSIRGDFTVKDVTFASSEISALEGGDNPEGDGFYVGTVVGFAGGSLMFENVTVRDAMVEGKRYVGTVCGYVQGTLTLENTSVLGDIRYSAVSEYGDVYGYAYETVGEAHVDTEQEYEQLADGFYHYGERYYIESENGLRAFASMVNRDVSFRGAVITLTKDIELYNEWAPIDANEGLLESAVIDGGGHTLSGLRITSGISHAGGYGQFVGFIGRTDGTLTIRNLTFNDVSVDLNVGGHDVQLASYAGILVGYTTARLTVENITVNGGSVIGGENSNRHSYVGGLVGRTVSGGLKSRFINVNVSELSVSATAQYAGGFVGEAEGALSFETVIVEYISVSGGDCVGGVLGGFSYYSGEVPVNLELHNVVFAEAQIDCNGRYAGGIAGQVNESPSGTQLTVQIEYCNVYAEIDAGDYAGGFIGYAGEGDTVNIKASSCVGEVRANNGAGGFIGVIASNGSVQVTENSAVLLVSVSGNNGVGGILGRAERGTTVSLNSLSAEKITVTGADGTGGFIGVIEEGGTVSVSNRTSGKEITVTGEGDAGGILGSALGATVTLIELVLQDSEVTGLANNTAGIVASASNLTINNLTVENVSVSGGGSSMAVVVASVAQDCTATFSGVNVIGCSATGALNNVGGLVGIAAQNAVVTVINSSVTGCTIRADHYYAGGLVGRMLQCNGSFTSVTVEENSISGEGYTGEAWGFSDNGLIVYNCNFNSSGMLLEDEA